MSRLPLAILGAALAAMALPEPAAAQSPSALDMIQRLQPGTGTRGIRRPTEDGATAAQPSPSLSPAAPMAAPRQLPAAPPPMATTAPADVPAVSITVQFASGSWSISPTAERALVPLGQALASPQLSAFRFRIEGHTDTVGANMMNRDLSQRRAEAVRDYLVNKFGVPGTRLEAVGLGESQLLVPTPDNMPEGRNRRVQVLNLGS